MTAWKIDVEVVVHTDDNASLAAILAHVEALIPAGINAVHGSVTAPASAPRTFSAERAKAIGAVKAKL